MQDLYWKIFSQTGNIETYLLIKEMEFNQKEVEAVRQKDRHDTSSNFTQEI